MLICKDCFIGITVILAMDEPGVGVWYLPALRSPQRLEFPAQQKILNWKHSLQQKGNYKAERLGSLPWWGHCVFSANLQNLHLRARRETQVRSCAPRSGPQTNQILRLTQQGLCTLPEPAQLPALAVGADPCTLSGNSSRGDLPFCWHEREL